MVNPPAEDELIILRELQALQREHAELSQFRSLAGGAQYSRLYELSRKYIPPEADVLDWGTGNGHFSYFLVTSGHKTTAYSFEPETFLSSLGRRDYRFVAGDATNPVTLPFPAETFDVVTSVGVLEHVRETNGDEVASLTELHRVLRPNGLLLCYHFPNRYSLIDAIARRTAGHHHTYRYTSLDISTMLQETSFQLIETRRYAILPRNPLPRLPSLLVDSSEFVTMYNTLDRALESVLSTFCTNHYFVARRIDRD